MEVKNMNDILLEEFIYKLFGYGNLNGPIWFIGMEEGGGNSLTEINNRLAAWDNCGKSEILDLCKFHQMIGINTYFRDPVKLQITWNKIIRIILSIEGKTNIHLDEIKKYQKEKLGRINGDNCLLELMPLPSPNFSAWIYSSISSIPYLSNRQVFFNKVLDFRINRLYALIKEHKPRFVIFYGITYMAYWKRISGIKQKIKGVDSISLAKNQNTVFSFIHHPCAHGLRNEYFHTVGALLRHQGI